jgi:hypothetical protein
MAHLVNCVCRMCKPCNRVVTSSCMCQCCMLLSQQMICGGLAGCANHALHMLLSFTYTDMSCVRISNMALSLSSDA